MMELTIILMEKLTKTILVANNITTLWKIVNYLDMSFIEFIKLLNKKLPKDFKLTDD